MTIQLEDIQNGHGPLYMRLADGIERGIYAGRLQPGDQLPTHRDLADALAMNVTTVTRGYKEAERRGLISGTVGRGTYVSSDAGTSVAMVSPEPHAPGMIEMGLVNPLYHLDPNLNEGLKNLTRRRNLSTLLHYTDPGGLLRHRTIGAEWINRFGLNVTAADIVICSGSQHGLTCALTALFRPGDRIATDTLTYPGMKALTAMLGLRLVPVEMDLIGMLPDSLDRICRRQKIAGLYLIPGVHNPTTITVPESRRDRLADIAYQHGLTIIEDDAYALTRPGIIRPLAARLPQKGVYIGGLSKALAAGLRVSFMAVPRSTRNKISEAILNTVWMTPPLNVELVCQWIQDGTVDQIIKDKRKEAAQRFALAAKILKGYGIIGQRSGFFIWLYLPHPWRGQVFEKRMRELGVNVFGAEKFTVGDASAPAAARISLTGAKDIKTLEKGLNLIRQVLDGEDQSDIQVLR